MSVEHPKNSSDRRFGAFCSHADTAPSEKPGVELWQVKLRRARCGSFGGGGVLGGQQVPSQFGRAGSWLAKTSETMPRQASSARDSDVRC